MRSSGRRRAPTTAPSRTRRSSASSCPTENIKPGGARADAGSMTLARGAPPAGLLAAAAAALIGAAGALAAAPARPAAATAVGIGEREFRISVYRPVVWPGTLRLNVSHRRQDVPD